MRTRLSVRQVYKGEIEEKLLNQLGADLTKRIMPQLRMHSKSYFVLIRQNIVILIKNTAKFINCTYLYTANSIKKHFI
ncbi:hypothetical protein CPT77_09755 [Snodgrassella alvi]|nr:hypothetical protein CPT77_09755 [Snodgrassella alvi]